MSFKHRYILGVILAIHLYIFPTVTCCLVFRQRHNVYLGSDWHEFVGVGLCINNEKSLVGKVLWGTHCTRQSVLQSRRLLPHFSQVITSKQANKQGGEHTHIQTHTHTKHTDKYLKALKIQLWLEPLFLDWDHYHGKEVNTEKNVSSFHSLILPIFSLLSDPDKTASKKEHEKQQIHSNCKRKKYAT